MYFVDSRVSGAKSGTVNTVVTVPCATPLTCAMHGGSWHQPVMLLIHTTVSTVTVHVRSMDLSSSS